MTETASDDMSPEELAEASGRVMWDDDRAARAVGMELLEVRPGYARLRMQVRRDMTNGHGICHGAYIFMLADTAFAYACNSHNQRAVAASAAIDFLAPVHEDDVLSAEGVEQYRAGRSGVYDMRVTNQGGKLVALFRGKSATIAGRFVEVGKPRAGKHGGHETGKGDGG